MTDLDRLEVELLQSARRGYAPNSSNETRVRRAAFSAIAAGVVVPTSAPTVSLRDAVEGLGQALTLPRVLVAAVALASAGAGGYALGLRHGQGRTTPSSKPPSAVAEVKAEAEAEVRVSSPQLPSPVAPAAPERKSPSAGAGVPSAARASTAELELSTLRRVERVLREGNPRLARALLVELNQSAPHGNLMQERLAAAAVAACQLDGGRPGTAAAFEARYPGSVYAARVREACGAGSDREQNVDLPETNAREDKVSP